MHEAPKLSKKAVTVLAYDGLCTFEYGVAVKVFALARPELDVEWYTFQVAALEPSIVGFGGVSIVADGGLELLPGSDLIIIPGWRDIDEHPPKALIEALRQAALCGTRIMSICSGAFVLGAAGLLDGRCATTHWRYADALRRKNPKVRVDDHRLYIEDRNMITAAGSSAAIDACLHVIQTDFGTRVANEIAKSLVMPPHRDGDQSQYVDAPIREWVGRSVAWVQDWARANLDKPIGVEHMAEAALKGVRTFQRRFKAATGTTPAKWLQQQRIKRAQDLLESTDMPLDHVADNCGFRSVQSFQRAFKGIIGQSAREYRNQFRSRQDCRAAGC